MKIEQIEIPGEKPYTQISYTIPLSTTTFIVDNPERIKEIAIDEFNLASTTLFELVQYLAEDIRCNPACANVVSDYLLLISSLGKSFQIALEEAHIHFKNEEQAKVLDLSVHPASIQRLNKPDAEKLIKKHKLPKEVSNILLACSEVQ